MCVWCTGFYVTFMVEFFCFKQKTAYEMRISDWSSDVCSSDLTTSTGDMPLISAGDMLPAPAMLALDIKNLFGVRFTLHGPSPSKERDRAARMPPGRVGSGRFAEFVRFLGFARCVAACVAARARAGELAAVDDQILSANA